MTVNPRCTCGHTEGMHSAKRPGMQAYCTKCKGGKSTHVFEAVAVAA